MLLKIVIDVVAESQTMSTEALSNDVFEQIKLEQECILNLADQTKYTSSISELSKYVYKPSEPMTGKLCFKSNSFPLINQV